jgi:hypothetical protein
MLSHSIGTFRHFFGSTADYVVYTDDVPEVRNQLLVDAAVVGYNEVVGGAYLDPRATWKKFAPSARVRSDAVEIRLDADMFLVDEPTELRQFIDHGEQSHVLVTEEWFSATWPYGNFGPLLSTLDPPINAGLIAQQLGCDISASLADAYLLWQRLIVTNEPLFHDDQGAVAYALETYRSAGEIEFLPHRRYRVVCPINDPPVQTLEGLAMIHATFPDHPAFWQFLGEISAISGVRDAL